MKKMFNATHIEGLLYQHSLVLKTTGKDSKNPGTEYISGNIEIATDNAMTNIVPVHFTYVTAVTSKGKTNDTFNTLKNIIDKVYKSCMEHGAHVASKFSIDSAIGLNEFYSDRSGQDELISVKRNEGGFVHAVAEINPDETKRNRFDVDIVITNVRTIEPDEENKVEEKAIVKGCIFNFRKDMMPVEFTVVDPAGIDYFMGLGASGKSPVFTRIKGEQISKSIVRKVVEESAFGNPDVKEFKNTKKDFVIDWTSNCPYDWDSDDTLTADELTQAINNRELYLAELKQNAENYRNSKGNAFATTTTVTPSESNSKDEFDF